MTSAVIDLEPRDRQPAKPPATATSKTLGRLKLFPMIAAVPAVQLLVFGELKWL